jgi:hypothetical protein
MQQDQAILSAFLSSSTPEVGAMIMFATTSREALSTIEGSFASQSTARAMQIRDQMRDLEKLDQPVTIYFNKLKSLSDTLTSIGQPLRQEEFNSLVLAGLDEDYDGLVEIVLDRTIPKPSHDLYSRLLMTEQRMANRRSSSSIHSANAARFGGSKPSRPNGVPSSVRPTTAPPYRLF